MARPAPLSCLSSLRASSAAIGSATLVLGFMAWASPLSAQIQFEPLVEIALPNGAFDVDIADLDNDGIPDLLTSPALDVLFSMSVTYDVVQGLGGGAFATPVQGATLPYSIVGSGEAIDMDGDGDVEWVIPRGDIFGNAFLFPGTSNLLFGTPTSIGSVFVNGGAALRVVDLLGNDDHLDVVLVGSNSIFFDPDSSYVALVADGLGGFTQMAGGDVEAGVHSLAVGDLDGNGWLDVVVTSSNSSASVVVHLATSATSWGAGTAVSTSASGTGNLELADVDDDGILDMLLTSADGLRLHLGNGDGTFATETAVGPAGGTSNLAVGDLDGDGDLDVLLSADFMSIEVLAGAGDGSFMHEGSIAAPRPLGMELADLDIDGDLDVAVALDIGPLFATDAVGVLINRSYGPGSPFTDLGAALAGSDGLPQQFADGALLPGAPASFDLFHGKPGGAAYFVIGLSALNAPFEGGVLVPAPDAIVFRGMDADGQASAGGTWPAGIASGSQLWTQWWFADAGGVFGWAGSNALRLDVP